jgi:hypothetical protein
MQQAKLVPVIFDLERTMPAAAQTKAPAEAATPTAR